jgi:hypothetical protein
LKKRLEKRINPHITKYITSISVCDRPASSADPGCERPQPEAVKARFRGTSHIAGAGFGVNSHSAGAGFGVNSHNARTGYTSRTISCGRSICCKYFNNLYFFKPTLSLLLNLFLRICFFDEDNLFRFLTYKPFFLRTRRRQAYQQLLSRKNLRN